MQSIRLSAHCLILLSVGSIFGCSKDRSRTSAVVAHVSKPSVGVRMARAQDEQPTNGPLDHSLRRSMWARVAQLTKNGTLRTPEWEAWHGKCELQLLPPGCSVSKNHEPADLLRMLERPVQFLALPPQLQSSGFHFPQDGGSVTLFNDESKRLVHDQALDQRATWIRLLHQVPPTSQDLSQTYPNAIVVSNYWKN